MRKLFILCSLLIQSAAFAQPSSLVPNVHHSKATSKTGGKLTIDYGRFDSIPFFNDTNQYTLATAGGLNSPQISMVDFNLDGINDIVIFERTSAKIKTFINRGVANKPFYKYAPEYEQQFPTEVKDMLLMRDFNNDGKADLFTVKTPGIGVYKNVSDTNGLKFEKVDYFDHTNVGIVDYLTSDFFGNFTSNIYLLPGDIPAIEDIDGDGDLDILNFGVWGVTVEFHRNLSVELTGGVDTLAFEYVTGCFGGFIENSTSNSVTFGYTCKGGGGPAPAAPRHAGSNILAIDLDADEDKDLILGDIGYNNLIALFNTGDKTYGKMTSMDTLWPSNDVSADLFIFPAAYYEDIDNDNQKEVIAAPNIGSTAKDAESVWVYEQKGPGSNPQFELLQKDFLQGEMIDLGTNAYPQLVDLNGDGLQDLVCGSYGKWEPSGTSRSSLVYFENIGDSSIPVFSLKNNDLGGLAVLGNASLYPSFGDMDNDGDLDMIIGNFNGKLSYYQNTGNSTNPSFTNSSLLGLDSIDVGSHAYPQLADLNEDGALDLIIGERNGTLNYIQNRGTNSSAIFLLGDLKENFGGIEHKSVINTGYLSPFAIKLDTLGRSYGADNSKKWYLFVAAENGFVYVYDGLENRLDSNFNIVDTLFTNVYRQTISMAELNGDSIADLVVGEFGGGFGFFFKGQGLQFLPPPPDTTNDIVELENDIKIFMYPNPATDLVNLQFETVIEQAQLKLISIDGKVLVNEQIPIGVNSAKINLADFKSGNYFVVIETKKGARKSAPLIID